MIEIVETWLANKIGLLGNAATQKKTFCLSKIYSQSTFLKLHRSQIYYENETNSDIITISI